MFETLSNRTESHCRLPPESLRRAGRGSTPFRPLEQKGRVVRRNRQRVKGGQCCGPKLEQTPAEPQLYDGKVEGGKGL